MRVSAILAAGGRGARIAAGVPKQMLTIGDRTILQRSFDTLEALDVIDEIVVSLPAEIAAAPPAFLTSARTRVSVAAGGATRHDSVANAFARIDPASAGLVVIHDAARPFAAAALFRRVIQAAASSGAAIAALRASDTIKEVVDDAAGARVVARTIPRGGIYLAQTPQVFAYAWLAEAIGRGSPTATDEATLVEQAGHTVTVVDGGPDNIKITTEQDLRVAEVLANDGRALTSVQQPVARVGIGYDLHRLEPGRKLILGGVEIPHEMGLIGHSDADVLCHAVTDAILGAASQGDIGRHFPDTDPEWKGADSLALLTRAAAVVREAGFAIVNVDAVVLAERPKLAPHVDAIRASLAAALALSQGAVSVKGKTNETVDAVGHGNAIAVHCVAMLAGRPRP